MLNLLVGLLLIFGFLVRKVVLHYLCQTLHAATAKGDSRHPISHFCVCINNQYPAFCV